MLESGRIILDNLLFGSRDLQNHCSGIGQTADLTMTGSTRLTRALRTRCKHLHHNNPLGPSSYHYQGSHMHVVHVVIKGLVSRLPSPPTPELYL